MPSFTAPVGNKPPQGYTPLDKIQNVPDHSILDIFGIVVNTRPPTNTRYECKMTLNLASPDLKHAYEDISFFERNEANLPTNVKIGDVVMIRRAKRTGSNYTSVKSQFMSQVRVFDHATIPDEAFVDAIMAKNSSVPSRIHPETKKTFAPPTPEEQYYAMQLKSWANRMKLFGTEGLSKSTGSTMSAKSSEIKRGLTRLSNLRSGNFYDVAAEVVKIWTDSFAVTVYVTDYTENPFFYDYGAQEPAQQVEWLSKPSSISLTGKFVLQVTLFSPHAEWASDHQQELVGRTIYLRNLNIQHNKRAANIEGKLHGDRQRPDQVDIRMLADEDPRSKEILDRRDQYYSSVRKGPDGHHSREGAEAPTKLTANQKRKASRKKKKEKEEREALERQELARQNAAKPSVFEAARGPNPNVVTTHTSKPCQSLRSIIHAPILHGKTDTGGHITFPFMNVIFRARVKVVDFMPDRLADFAQRLDDANYNNVPESPNDDAHGHDSDIEGGTPGTGWEWAFSLLLSCDMDSHGSRTNEPEHMMVVVQGKDADYLLNLTACDLRRNPEVLQQLRDRLFILWGELEEAKKKNAKDHDGDAASWPLQVKNRPFECCVQEYGVLDDDGEWIRMHRMTGTRIRQA